jgi:diadenosine tetraphosphate (Ap4A) HIT family hydrolase
MKGRPRVDVENAEIVPRQDYVATLKEIVEEGFCPFCEEHLFKHHRKPLLFKNAHWLVTENFWPYDGVKRQFLLITRKHISHVTGLSPEGWKALGSACKRLARDYGLKGGTLLMRFGDTAYTGASVSHLHAQIIIGGKRSAKSKEIRALVGFKR